jgi:hypothetical protein
MNAKSCVSCTSELPCHIAASLKTIHDSDAARADYHAAEEDHAPQGVVGNVMPCHETMALLADRRRPGSGIVMDAEEQGGPQELWLNRESHFPGP